MRLSVIIPTFNRVDFLPLSVRSLLEQTRPADEIIVVDDGSTQDVAGAVAQFGDRIRLVRQDNAGKSAALNTGFEACTGDAISILDDDDLFPPTTLEAHVRALEENPGADFSWGGMARFESGRDPAASTDFEPLPLEDPRRLVIKLMENCFLSNPAWVVRSRAWRDAGPYRPDLFYSQDYDMILKLARFNDGIYVPQVVLYQRKHVGARGPVAERVVARNTVDQWVTYDRGLFEEMNKAWTIDDFHPFRRGIADEREERVAWLQRGVIMFMRKAYPESLAALDTFLSLQGRKPADPLQVEIATGLLYCRYGVDDIVQVEGLGRDLGRVLRGRASLPLRRAMANAMRWLLRDAVRAGSWGLARSYAAFGAEAFGLDAMAATMPVKLVRRFAVR